RLKLLYSRSLTPTRSKPARLKICPRFLPWHFEYKGQDAWRLCQAARNLRSNVRAGAPKLQCRSATLDPSPPRSKSYSQARLIPQLAPSFARSQSADQRPSQGINHLRHSKISSRSFNSSPSTSFGFQSFPRLSTCATYLSRMGSINKTFMTQTSSLGYCPFFKVSSNAVQLRPLFLNNLTQPVYRFTGIAMVPSR